MAIPYLHNKGGGDCGRYRATQSANTRIKMFTYAAKTPADTGRRLRWVSGGELALGVSTDITNTGADYIGKEAKCRLERRYTNMRAMHRTLCLCSSYVHYRSDRREIDQTFTLCSFCLCYPCSSLRPSDGRSAAAPTTSTITTTTML